MRNCMHNSLHSELLAACGSGRRHSAVHNNMYDVAGMMAVLAGSACTTACTWLVYDGMPASMVQNPHMHRQAGGAFCHLEPGKSRFRRRIKQSGKEWLWL